MALEPLDYEEQTSHDSLLRRVSNGVIATLKPSFLHKPSKATSSRPRRSTAWLDGVRGFASFLVFIYHFQHMFHKAYEIGYGSNGGNNDH